MRARASSPEIEPETANRRKLLLLLEMVDVVANQQSLRRRPLFRLLDNGEMMILVGEQMMLPQFGQPNRDCDCYTLQRNLPTKQQKFVSLFSVL
jgi:hypothetical protein